MRRKRFEARLVAIELGKLLGSAGVAATPPPRREPGRVSAQQMFGMIGVNLRGH